MKSDVPHMHINGDGYLRIHKGPLRNKYAHRVYAERQLGRPLRDNEHVHHDCRNKLCWPPTDFHLVVMDSALHSATEAGMVQYWVKKKVKREADTEAASGTGGADNSESCVSNS